MTEMEKVSAEIAVLKQDVSAAQAQTAQAKAQTALLIAALATASTNNGLTAEESSNLIAQIQDVESDVAGVTTDVETINAAESQALPSTDAGTQS